MSAQLWEIADLVARWIHVIAGIMWVGNSMLFNWLDRNLRPRSEPDVYGDIWLIHSGGFYLVEKNQGERTATGGRALPRPLHWFKWQAYTTWLTGAALLLIVYYAGGRAVLTDPAVRDMARGSAVSLAAGAIVGSWVLYETLWRTVGRRWPALAGVACLVLFVVVVHLLTRNLNGHAAWLHVGALLGTIMAGNVAFTIMPSQRELVAALEQGRAPSQAIADRAKTRSIHNNYITFPVILLMLSGHFPSLYAGAGGATKLLVLVATGAAIRHVLNIRFSVPRWRWALAGTMAAGLLLLAVTLEIGPFARRASSVRPAASDSVPAVVTFDDARRVIDRRCAACHSRTPSDLSFGAMPAGVAFDTPEQIRALVQRIRERAVVTKTMPPGNKTRITEAERAVLAKWIDNH